MSATSIAGRRQLSYVAASVAFVAGAFLLGRSGWPGSIELHAIVEIIATLLAVTIGILALVRYYSRKDRIFLAVGCAFLGVGTLDGYHAVVTSSYFANLISSSAMAATPWSWLGSRLFLTLMMLLCWSSDRYARIGERGIYGVTLASFAICLLIVANVLSLSPRTTPGMWNLIPAVLFALALVLHLLNGKWRDDAFAHWLVLSLVAGCAAQAFMALSARPYDAMLDFAAVVKTISYLCVLTGLLIDTYRMIHLSAAVESRQLLDVVINTVGATIFWKDRNLVYLGCNAAFARDAGFAGPEDIIGKDDYQMGWREQADLYRADDRQVIESGRSKLLIEEPQTTPDGRHITLLTNKVPLRNAEDEIIGIVGTYVDITERKRLNEILRSSEEKFRALVESTTDCMWEVDTNRAYTYVSPVIERLAGYKPEELLGKPMLAIMTPQEAQRFARAIATSVATHESFSRLDMTVIGKDGRETVLETSAVPVFDRNGIYSGYRGIARDVTDRKRAERAVQRRDALTHAASVIARTLVISSSLDDAIRQALELISRTIQVDRIVVLERTNPERPPFLRYIWESSRITVNLDQTFFESPQIDTPELLVWNSPLAQGALIEADIRTASPAVRTLLEAIGVPRILILPIMVDGKYWGQIGFDSCDPERVWAPYEAEILQTVAELLGTAVQRERYVKELADANRIVQSTPTILYRMRGVPSFPMIYISQNIRLFGHDPAVLTASPFLYRNLIHPDDLGTMIDAMTKALAGKSGITELRLLTSKGEFRWVENHYMPLLDGAGRLVEVEGLLSDITERKAAEEKIARLARTDSLTGLPNRATFTERLRQLFAASRRGSPAFSLLYIDLDRYKDINDTLGHPVGDRVLVSIGERLRSCIRDTDLAARVGGDEFAVLQSDVTDSADAGTLAEKLRTAIAEPMQIAGNELRVTASVGIAIYGSETNSADDMLAQADVALYRAKDEGRDQYRFHTEEIDVQVRDQVALSEELRRAIERHELEVYYQPQVELNTNRIAGMEALIRWNHPKRGLLLPGQFIELAERTGAIVTIGQWVLDAACRQMSVWRAAGIAPQVVAVNVSPVQIKAGNEFVEFVGATLSKWQLTPADLELDVTESTLARATLMQNDVLERLQKMGINISIDDFGMKYSSLDYLKTYHVNRIKIPQILVDAASRDRDSAATMRAILGIARELNIDIVAEGVETEKQWSFLATEPPVAKVQGFYYSKPVPADAATNLLKGKHITPGASHRLPSDNV
ncbi:MAG TPA: EAL domain-containing protein [Pseudolabrys sp.]|nr:EAL domain-containing protein [Pseudolabrys sp.]